MNLSSEASSQVLSTSAIPAIPPLVPTPLVAPSTVLHQEICAAVDDLSRNRYRLAALLSEVKQTESFRDWGHKTLKAYYRAELALFKGKGRLKWRSWLSLIQIHEVFILKLRLTPEQLKMDWSKAQEIANPLEEALAAGRDIEPILEHGRTLSVRTLRAMYPAQQRSTKKIPSSPSTPPPLRLPKLEAPGLEKERLTYLQGLLAVIPVLARQSWPKAPADFYIAADDWRQICLSLSLARTTLIMGPAGCGKTESVKHCAAAFGRPLEVFNFGAMSEPRTSLIGVTEYAVEKGTYFVMSRFIRALTTPGMCILLDEVNRCPPEAYNMLIPVLDGQRSLSIDERPDMPVIRVADNVCIFASANIGNEYHGTEALDKAIKDRFATVISLTFPPLDAEVAILTTRVTGLSQSAAKTLCQFANHQRELWREGDFAELISTRALLSAAAQIPHGISLKEALKYSVVNSFSAEGGERSDRTKLQQLLQKLG